MIEIGCNYSPELIKLIDSEAVHVDWIKLSKEHQFHDQFKAINQRKPVLIHFIPGVSSKACSGPWDIPSLNKAIYECRSPHVALHLRAVESDYNDTELSKGLEREVHRRVIEKKNTINSRVLIENMPVTCLSKGFTMLADPAFISDLCTRNDVGLCLDTAHARISAHYRNESIDEYLLALPLDRVEEVHLSGPRMDGDRFRDMHEELTEIDYGILSTILKKTRPRVITLEYGGEGPDFVGRSDAVKIESQLKRIREMIQLNHK